MSLHSLPYKRSSRYHEAHARYVMFGAFRLNGAGRTVAAVSIIAHKICGTPMYTTRSGVVSR
jgi:hypothetical protein